ncbi:transposable element Tcb2 transposase [Trichonephila clavipes]|nr:transposable element Tcb2 transposase [Trichonephila clavipes]
MSTVVLEITEMSCRSVLQKKTSDFYKLANKNDILKQLYTRNQFVICKENLFTIDEIYFQEMSLREAAAANLKNDREAKYLSRLNYGEGNINARHVQHPPLVHDECRYIPVILNRFLETGSAGRRPGQGSRRATTPNEDHYLVLTARSHRNKNAIYLQQHLHSATGTTVSTQTVRNWTHGVDLYARRPMVCVRLTSRHNCNHREWATEHVNWRRNEWSNVLFSNESRFSVHPNNRRIFIWRGVAVRILLRSCTKVSDLAVGECWCMVASPFTGAQASTSFEMDL